MVIVPTSANDPRGQLGHRTISLMCQSTHRDPNAPSCRQLLQQREMTILSQIKARASKGI
jgi:hypothetical protein